MNAARNFRIGQIWEPRNPDHRFSRDHWRIEAITDHPISPVIARHHCGAIRCFDLAGIHDGDEEQSGLDLVTLVRDVGGRIDNAADAVAA